MTEDEAKKKWCPMVRHAADRDGGFHVTNGQKSAGFQNCIASDCMMWQWDNNPKQPECDYYNGHCGLAGKNGN